MSNLIHYSNCPLCGSGDIKNVLFATDHTVSGESFPIAACQQCTLRFTQDVPDATAIAAYYRSEDYISHSNTSKGLINRLYLYVRKRTIKKKRKLIGRSTGKSTGRLLDVGSGTGAFLNEMKQHGWEVSGIEPDAGARTLAKKIYNIESGDSSALFRFPADSFDVITLWHVLEHVHDLYGTVQQLKVLLKNDGKIFIAVPNYTSKDAAIYGKDWAGYDVPRHLFHFSPRAMEVLAKKTGLKILHYKPMMYDSFYISMLSSKYKNECKKNSKGNARANLFASFWNGCRSNLQAISNPKKCSSVIYVTGK